MRHPQLLRRMVPLVVVAALALFAIGWSFTFKQVPPMLIRGFQPAAFPRLVAGSILVLAAIALFHELRRDEVDPRNPLPAEFSRTALLLAVVGALVALNAFLVALMAATAGLAFLWGERRVPVLLALGIVAPILVVLFFDTAFEVRFPRGVLLNFYYG